MKIIVSGGRDYKEMGKVFEVLNGLNPKTIIVGDCPTGVDSFVAEWQRIFKQDCDKSGDSGWPKIEVYKADWVKYGNPAGPIRNRKMCEDHQDANFLIAFPGGKGTKNCTEEAKDLNIVVLKVD